MRRLLLAVAVMPLVAVSLFAEPPGAVEAIGSARVSVVVHPSQTKFSADLPKHVWAAVLSPLFGAAIAGAKTGEEMVKKFSIPDPALHLRDAFLKGLQEKSPLNVEMVAEDPGEDAKDLKKQLTEGFVLDFKTVVWDLTVFMGDHDHYRIEYWGRARLIRLEKRWLRTTARFSRRSSTRRRKAAQGN